MSGSILDQHVAGLQLSQLRVMDAVYSERSVRKAAERLHRTPSAISHSLNMLRSAFGDELFVRRQDGMHPTVRAHEIATRVRAALHMLDEALSIEPFDPASSKREFRVASPPYMNIAIGPKLAVNVGLAAPGVGIRLQPLNSSLGRDLEHGTVDLGIIQTTQSPSWLRSILLVKDEMVFAIRAGHSRGKRALRLSELADLRHVDVQMGDDLEVMHAQSLYKSGEALEWANRAVDQSMIDALLAARGLTRKVAMTVPDTSTALAIVAESDMITFCGRHAAEQYQARYPLTLLAAPFAAPTRSLRMIWTQWHDTDGGQIWLREMIVQQVKASLHQGAPLSRAE